MRRLFRKIHLWLSLPVGIVITIICLTGAILVFQEELLEINYSNYYKVNGEHSGETILSLDELIPLVDEQLNSGEIENIQLFADTTKTYKARVRGDRRTTIFINPYTAKVQGALRYSDTSFYPVMQLHRTLLFQSDARIYGKHIVGYSVLFLILIIISGIVLWFPRRKKQVKHAFRIKWRNGKRRLWYDVHRVLGFYSVLLLLLMALTGLMWSFSWYRNGVVKLFSQADEIVEGKNDRKKQPEKKKVANYAVWDKVIASLKEEKTYVSIRIDKSGTIMALPRSAWHERAVERISYDVKTGELKGRQSFGETKGQRKIMSVSYSLHTGAFGSFFCKNTLSYSCFDWRIITNYRLLAMVAESIWK